MGNQWRERERCQSGAQRRTPMVWCVLQHSVRSFAGIAWLKLVVGNIASCLRVNVGTPGVNRKERGEGWGTETRDTFLIVYLHPGRKRPTDVHIFCVVAFLILHNVTIQADAMPQPRIKIASNLQVNRKICCWNSRDDMPLNTRPSKCAAWVIIGRSISCKYMSISTCKPWQKLVVYIVGAPISAQTSSTVPRWVWSLGPSCTHVRLGHRY